MAKGRITIVRGKTYDHRETLKEHGFRWHPGEKLWWRDGAIDHNEQMSLGRKIGSTDVEIKVMREEFLDFDPDDTGDDDDDF